MPKSVSVLALVALSVSAQLSGAAQASLSGTVMYRERIALSPDAVLELTLEDTSRADAAAIVIASGRFDRPGQVPIAFELPFDPALVVAGGRYVVRARIMDRGVLAFISTQSYTVDPAAADTPLTIVVQSVQSAPPAVAPTRGPALEDTEWVIAQVYGRAVPFGPAARDARLRLVQAEQRAQGSTGCNSISGAYDHRGSALTFTRMISTRMACAPPTMEQEQQVLKMFEATRSWRVVDAKLELLDAGGVVIAQLAAAQ